MELKRLLAIYRRALLKVISIANLWVYLGFDQCCFLGSESDVYLRSLYWWFLVIAVCLLQTGIPGNLQVLFPLSCSPFIAHSVSSASSPFPPRAPPTGPRGPGGGRHRHRGKLQRLCRGHDASRPDRDMESEAAARRGRDHRGHDGAAERAQGAGVPPRHGGADSVAHEPPRR